MADINQLIEKALEGTEYALNSQNNLSSLPGADVLPSLKKGLLKFKEDQNLTDLRVCLDSYKKSNMLQSGKTEYDAVWYKDVKVQGESVLLGSLFDDLENTAWEMVKTDS